MSDNVIGRCPKCGMSLTAGHSCGFDGEFRNPFLENTPVRKEEFQKFVADFDERLSKLEGKQPQPAPKLVEAVEAFQKTVDVCTCYAIERDRDNIESASEAVSIALAAEKRRQELVEQIIKDVRFAVENGILKENSALAYDLRNLDDFDKERGA